MRRRAQRAINPDSPAKAPHPKSTTKAPRLLTAVGAVAAALIALPLAIMPVDAQNGSADTPFACDPGFYQVIAGQLKAFDAQAGTYINIGEDGANFNAMAYRTTDGYLYGIRQGDIVRIDAEGDIESIGDAGGASSAYTGDIGDDGLLYASKGGKGWHSIDLDTFEVMAVAGMDTTSSGPADVANVHGLLYGIGRQGNLFVFDPANRSSTEGSLVAGLPRTNAAYGAAWTTAGGNLYVGRNTGEIYQVTGYSGDSPKATQVATAPATNSNDGGSCPVAVTPPGLSDVDGPQPETEPQTREAQEASQSYNDNYDEVAETYSEPVGSEVVMPQEHAPVTTDNETYEPTPETEVETGSACEANIRQDRPPRVQVPEIAAFTKDTVLFSTSFDTSPLESFKILNGEWLWENETFAQAHDCGFDTTVALRSPTVDHYRWEARFSSVKEDNHGGLLLNQSSLDTRSGASLFDLAEGGNVIRWGYYDNKGYYQHVQSFPITRPTTGQQVALAAEVRGDEARLFYNGRHLADVPVTYTGGLVGLVVNATPVAFHDVTLTGLAQI